MRILFWGTPAFAVPSLRALTEEGHDIVAAVTRPDRPAGRGRTLSASPVKRECADLGIPVLQPERPGGEAFLEELRKADPEITVLVAYGAILGEDVLSLPPRGSLNVHASLLPELRGAAPVNWAIIHGLEMTGVTIMRMVRELDAGPILHQIPIEIHPKMTAGELHARCAELGAEALVETLAMLAAGKVVEREQDHDRASYAPKLEREDARLDWRRPAEELDRWIRGCDPWPAAWSELRGDPVQIFDPAARPGRAPAEPGTVVSADASDGIEVAAGDGAVRIGEVKPSGRVRMDAAAWVRGRGVAEGDRFD